MPATGGRPSASYGGVDYGFGYTDEGYRGGYWSDRRFFYNRAVNNLGGANIATVFNQPFPAPGAGVNRISFNGGQGTVRPTHEQLTVARERHVPPTAVQLQHQHEASRIASLRYPANHGVPPVAAVSRPNAFHGAHVVTAAAAATAACTGQWSRASESMPAAGRINRYRASP